MYVVCCRKYAVVRFIGFEACDVVPTQWITLEIGDGEIVGVWYPNCHVSQPRKCLQMVKAGLPPNKTDSKLYEVKMLHLSDSWMKVERKVKESLYKSDINTDGNEDVTEQPQGKRRRM